MQCLVIALKAESNPLIEYFNLKKNDLFSFPCFVNLDIEILVVGVGVGKKSIKHNIKEVYNYYKSYPLQFINFGVSGGRKKITKIGEMFMINKINDEESKRALYPDIIVNHGMSEGEVTTVKKVVKNGGMVYPLLVDMESFTVFEVCKRLVDIKNIAIIKIVSDHMNIESSDFQTIDFDKLINPKIKYIERFLASFKSLLAYKKPVLSQSDMDWYINVKNILNLTETQSILLLKSAKYFRINNSKVKFPKVKDGIKFSKKERNAYFQELNDVLFS